MHYSMSSTRNLTNKRILIIGRRNGAQYFFSTHDFIVTYDCIEDIEQEGVAPYVARRVRDGFDGVLGVCEIATTVAHVIAAASGCNAPSQAAMLACQNKFISRNLQAQCVPKHVPAFCLSTDQQRDARYPIFVKPVRGSLSSFAQVVHSPKELDAHISAQHKNVIADNSFYESVLQLGHYKHEYLHTYKNFLCEELLRGTQVCVDGFVYDGNVTIFGTTRAHLLEGTLSFSRWDYPVHYTGINHLVKKLIAGIGLDNTCFNVELMVDGDDMHIIEVHARPSAQFAPLIKHVTGVCPLRAACLVALGRNPLLDIRSARGSHTVCCSCVLRKKNDALVTRVPTQDEIERIEREYPGVEVIVLADVGKRLSDYRQDCDTYRYGLITVPGVSFEEVEATRREIEARLMFTFED